MQLEITYVNKDRDFQYDQYSLPIEESELRGLFRRLSRQFGRCVSKIYVGEDKPVGWVFEKKQPYEDKGYFIQETWITVHANT